MTIRAIAAVACAAAVSISAANAGVIVGPVGASSNIPKYGSDGYELDYTYDQSGLSAAYTSGVTDFDAFVASTTHDGVFSTSIYGGGEGYTQAQVVYDLGGLYDLESFVLWNRGIFNQGIASFELVFSETADFSVTTVVSGLTGGTAGSTDFTVADIYAFNIVRAAYVQLNILSTYNQFNIITFGEVAFEGTAAVSDVPLPAALPLFFAGLAGLGFASRRKKKTA